VVVIAAGRDEERAGAVALHQVEAQDLAVEALRLGDAGHVQVNVAHDRAGRHAPRLAVRGQGQQTARVQRLGDHLQVAVAQRPLGARPVTVDLDAVAVGVGQVDGLADAMVRPALQRPAGFQHMPQPAGQVRPAGQQQGEVVEASGAGRLGPRAGQLHQMQQRRVASRQQRAAAAALSRRQPQHIAVETQRAVQVANGQADRAHVGSGVQNRLI